MTETFGGFDEIYGHDSVKRLLSAALNHDRIGHAYIFTGPAGVGRYTTAKAFANGIVGTSKAQHPDIITVTNELYGVSGKTDAILVDTVSEMRKDIFIMPYSAKRKVYIIPKADTMNVASQNKLLKVFEEPPEYCTIIFITENHNKMLPTVLSRATVIRFSPLADSLVAKYLIERRGIPESEAAVKAVIGGGSIGKALEVLDSADPGELRSRAISGLTALRHGENKYIFEFARFLKGEKDNIPFILSVLRSFFDDLMHMKLGITDRVSNRDKQAELNELCKAVTEQCALNFLDITAKYERVFKTNANFRIAAFCMSCEYWEELHGRNYRSTI